METVHALSMYIIITLIHQTKMNTQTY